MRHAKQWRILSISLGVRRSTMRRTRLLTTLLACVVLITSLHANCTRDQDKHSSKTSSLLITDFTISGTQTIDSAELARITSQLTGDCFDENPEELEERVRALFKDRGYMDAVVKNLRIKPGDPLALPKPVSLEAEVIEGQRFTVAEIKFVGNHVFSTSQLRSEFSLKKGDLFARDKIASGLDGVSNLYASDGFVDWTAIPDTQKLSDGTVVLAVSIAEGPQYRMGRLEIFARKELADRLRAEWELPEGAVFDFRYIYKYIDRNRSLLPPEFVRKDVQLVRDCRDSSVEVRLPLDGTDPRSQSQPKDIDCRPEN
jgi:outer membrane protein assembly factor BamA